MPIIVVFKDDAPETVTESVAVQTLESVTVTTYIPEPKPVRSSVEAELDQEKVYGAAPPETG